MTVKTTFKFDEIFGEDQLLAALRYLVMDTGSSLHKMCDANRTGLVMKCCGVL